MQKITDLKNGQKARITAVDGDRRYLSRITSIGLTPGCNIEVLQNVKPSAPYIWKGYNDCVKLQESGRIMVEVT